MTTVTESSSGSAVDKPLGSCKTSNGFDPKRCTCRSLEHGIKEVIENGLKILRVRFRLPSGELPYLQPSQLSRYLLKLLSPSLPPLPFPRLQTGWDDNGFPRFQRLSKMDRWRFASSCASIKRALPIGVCEAHPPPPIFPAWKAKMVDQIRTSSVEYQSFARQVAAEVFKPDWDRTYKSFCYAFVPKYSSRAETHSGGIPIKASQWWSNPSHPDRQDYLSYVLSGNTFSYDHASRYKEVPTVGKTRAMIIPSVSLDLLGPLHKAIYQHLASLPWLLKGSPSVEKLRRCLDKEWLTSVDLVAASDGLTLDVADICLDRLQSTSRVVPAGIFERARSSLRPEFTHKGDVYRIASGQNMGQYLSFPLLCFQSYVAARWATRGEDAEIAINGDDCLIGCGSPSIVDRYPDHLEINRDKTAVSRAVAEINSTQFVKMGKWKEVRTARRLGGSSTDLSGLVHMAQSCRHAGDRWVTAFIHSRVGQKSRVSPIDLGLSALSNRAVFMRLRGMTQKRAVPVFIPPTDGRLEKVERKLVPLETEALRECLFDGGRIPTVNEPDYKIKKLSYIRMAPRPYLTYAQSRLLRERKKEKKEIAFRVRTEAIEPPSSVMILSLPPAQQEVLDRRIEERCKSNISLLERIKKFEEARLRGRSR